MIGLDTNVLVRYIAQDDPEQSQKASQIIESFNDERCGYITCITLVELVWVLSRSYKVSKPDLCNIIESILQVKYIIVQDAETVWKALKTYKNGVADFADCLIVHTSINIGCSCLVTLDSKVSKHINSSFSEFQVQLLD